MSRRKVIVIAAALSSVALAVSGLIAAQSGKTPKLTADDYVEIQQLYSDYAYALDQNEGDRLVNTFVEGGSFTSLQRRPEDPRRTRKGKEELSKMRGSGYRHFIADLHITRTPEGANASCVFLQFDIKNTPATLALNGVYEDTLVKTPQGWKFKDRKAWREGDDMSPFKPLPR